jgi:hypothetical protein
VTPDSHRPGLCVITQQLLQIFVRNLQGDTDKQTVIIVRFLLSSASSFRLTSRQDFSSAMNNVLLMQGGPEFNREVINVGTYDQPLLQIELYPIRFEVRGVPSL